MPKAKPLYKEVVTRTHWSEVLRRIGACTIPETIASAPTPEIAWKRANAGQLTWCFMRFPGGPKHGWAAKVENIGDDDSIRKVYPKPPAYMLKTINLWIRGKW